MGVGWGGFPNDILPTVAIQKAELVSPFVCSVGMWPSSPVTPESPCSWRPGWGRQFPLESHMGAGFLGPTEGAFAHLRPMPGTLEELMSELVPNMLWGWWVGCSSSAQTLVEVATLPTWPLVSLSEHLSGCVSWGQC